MAPHRHFVARRGKFNHLDPRFALLVLLLERGDKGIQQAQFLVRIEEVHLGPMIRGDDVFAVKGPIDGVDILWLGPSAHDHLMFQGVPDAQGLIAP